MKKNIWVIIFFCVLLAFILLAFLAKAYPYFSIDLNFTLFLQQFKFAPFYNLMVFVSAIGYGAFKFLALGLIAAVLFIKKLKKEAAMLTFSTLGAELLSDLLKTIISRHRPDPKLIKQLLHFDKLDSFPSGHVLFYVCFFGFLIFILYKINLDKKMRTILAAICVFFIIAVGPSRIYLGAHWLSDVTGAYLAGFIWLSISIFVYNRWRKNEKNKS